MRAAAWLLLAAAPCLAQARYPVQVDGRWGFVDEAGELVIAAKFDTVSTFADGLARVELGADRSRGSVDHSTARHGFVDVDGKLVIAARYDFAHGFSEGLAVVRKDRRYGFVDTSGELVIPTRYPHRVGDFHQGRAYVELNRTTLGYLDRAGKVVLRVTGADVSDPGNYSEGLVRVAMADDSVRFYDLEGELAFAPEVAFAGPFADGLARARTADGWGYLDQKGGWAIAPGFDRAGNFSEGHAVVRKDGKAFYIDRSGKQALVPDGFDQLRPFHSGLAFVRSKENGRFGFVDTKGRWVLEPKWDDPYGYSYFEGGLARVADKARGPKWRGWIDRTGRLVWPRQ